MTDVKRCDKDTPEVPEGMGSEGLGTQIGAIGGGSIDELRRAPKKYTSPAQVGGSPKA